MMIYPAVSVGTLVLGYIGPGAGFAFLGSFLVLLTAILLVCLAILSWPFRVLISLVVRRKRKRAKTPVRRAIIVGLDGLDPKRCERLIGEGQLPHFAKLKEEGGFRPLTSTCPPISPVAWSSFMTGANPGKHNIFDFLNRDLRTYLPELSSSRIEFHGGKRKPTIKLLRKSKPFWEVLGEYGVFSTVLRVPITFPAEKFHGLSISGMCVPDLQGTQGTFTSYSDAPVTKEYEAGGQHIQVRFEAGKTTTWLPGPPGPGGNGSVEFRAPLRIRRLGSDRVELQISGQKVVLSQGCYSDWIRVGYRVGVTQKVYGICRFYLAASEPEFRLYVTPVNIDPERPALPISNPPYYSIYLAKLLGPYATRGLAEDTWARNEGVIDDETFLEQVYSIHEEREKMFFEALRRTRKGLCACVFDASDRIQHMFMRQAGARDKADDTDTEIPCERVIDDMYVRMDDLVGRVLAKAKKSDVVIVLSDHGFTNFERGVNLNVWLRDAGLLVEREDADKDDYLQAVDWDKTKAYTFGLSGIYINRKGRESKGIVADEEASEIKEKVISGLQGLQDDAHGRSAVKAIYDADEAYTGPYKRSGPDLVVGFQRGYRASWDGAIGKTRGELFSDNDKAWSGDHCVDRSLVPGVLFCNRRIESDEELELMDLAPTVLNLFGVPVPSYMDGTPVPLQMGRK